MPVLKLKPFHPPLQAPMAHHVNDEITRLAKRQEAISSIQRTPAYIVTVSSPNRPTTPDPLQKMSKRAWEDSVQTWRYELRCCLFSTLKAQRSE